MVISEWLPNPAGSDAAGEWLELWNEGPGAVDLSGWRLTNGAGKKAMLHGQIGQGAYMVLPRSATKLTLRNTDDSLRLYGANGVLVDEASFKGEAPEGRSANSAGEFVYFAVPTPGKGNVQYKEDLVQGSFEWDRPFGADRPLFGPLLGMLGTGITLAILVVFMLKAHARTEELFFGSH